MKQLEIEFFYPLTEQIPLDLDFTESDEFRRELFRRETVSVLNHTGAYTTAPTATSFHIQPSNNYVGHWEVSGKDFQIFRENRPSWLHRKFNQLLIGWVWVDDK
jgi:hypothetical protein